MTDPTRTTLCPFCNAVLPPLAAPPTADKVQCPRCGEPVPASYWQVDTATAIASGAPKIAPPTANLNLPGKRMTASILVSIMIVMAIISLSYALLTTNLRRSRDPKPLLDPITIRGPLELQGLGYLPKDSQVIVGLHIAELLNDKQVGQPLLAEPRPAMLDWVVKQLPRMTGLQLEEIDHVVLSATFDPLRAVMVVKTRRPYSLEKIVDSIRPSPSDQYLDKPLYYFALNPLGTAMLWCPEEKTLVCVIPLGEPKVEHLQGLALEPRKIEEVLSAPLHEAMKERLPKSTFMWSVGRLDQLGALKDLLPLAPPAAKPYVDAVKDLRTFAVSLAPSDGVTLTGYFQMTDAKAAEKFQKVLKDVKIEGAASHKVVPPPADAPEQWVTWQVRGDVAAMREFLNRSKDPKN